MNVKGKTVCVTGVLAGMKRDEAEAALTKLGARVVGSVSKNTDILFVGASAGSKLAKAESLGVQIVDEAGLHALLGGTVSRTELKERKAADVELRELEAEALAGEGDVLPKSVAGLTVVVTGTLSVDRVTMESMLEAAGAKVTGSVSKNTNLLVVGSGAGSKLSKAQSLGIQSLNEEQIRQVLSGGGGAAKPAKKEVVGVREKSPPSGDMNELCGRIEAFFDALEKAGGIELTRRNLPGSDKKKLADLESKLGVTLPDDVRAFLTRGLQYAQGSVDGKSGFGSIGFDFIKPDNIIKSTKIWRDIAKDTDEDDEDEHTELQREGVCLTHSEPQLVWTPNGIFHYSVRNPVKRVCGTWTEFLEAWLASGCFSSHSFDAVWPPLSSTLHKKPAKNVWLDYYRKQFPGAK